MKDINFADNEKENQPPEQPQVPNDPAILGVSSDPFTLLPNIPVIASSLSTCYTLDEGVEKGENLLRCYFYSRTSTSHYHLNWLVSPADNYMLN